MTSRKATKINRTQIYYTLTRSHQAHQLTTKRVGYEFYSSSEEEYQEKSYVTWYEDPDFSMPNILTFHFQPTGTPHPGFPSIKTVNTRFDTLMTYISYLVMIKTDTRSLKETEEVWVHIKNLNRNMKNHKFDGTEAIPDFYFLVLFVNTADMLNMSEVQAGLHSLAYILI